MQKINQHSEHFSIALHLIRWSFIIIPIAVVIGSSVAFFLWSLDAVTHIRWQNPWLLFLLPLAGVLVYLVYKKFGGDSEKGNNLIIDEIHQPGGGVPRRMGVLVLFGTLVTHLFGGSAGREGTAVQMGGSIGALFSRWFALGEVDTRIVLIASIAAGFGAVFGTPVTGAIFAIEVLTIGRLQYDALLPGLIAAVVGDAACTAWGIHHTQYHILFNGINTSFLPAYFHIDLLLLCKVIVAGIAFGLAGYLFAEMVHRLKHQFKTCIRPAWLIPVAGAAIVIALVYVTGTRAYLGLGVTSNNPADVTILSTFKPGGADSFSWLWKTLFTAITLSCGFKGGEVTPLFFIGAALGNTLAVLMGAPVDLFAGLGFIAVFAGATNTPIACTVMGIELFGGGHTVYFAVACFTAYVFSGHSGIYTSQKIGVPKIYNAHFSGETSLNQSFERRKKFSGGAIQYVRAVFARLFRKQGKDNTTN